MHFLLARGQERHALRTAAIFALLFLTAASPAAASARHVSGNSGKHLHVTCNMVRAYVAKVGMKKARATARSHGITAAEEKKARRCLASSI